MESKSQEEFKRMSPQEQINYLNESRKFKTWFQLKNESYSKFRQDLGIKPALVKHVEDPQEGLLAKLMMIRQAQYTLDLTYYIFKNDNSGYALLNELKSAVKRGVNIRFMVDSLGSINLRHPTHSELKALIDYANENAGFMKNPETGLSTNVKANVEVVIFRSANPLHLGLNTVRKIYRQLWIYMNEKLKTNFDIETVYIIQTEEHMTKF
jgi:phosphatidylserine/phosphatidylglycerophosphate/cardiolipin synthase-like enzyme